MAIATRSLDSLVNVAIADCERTQRATESGHPTASQQFSYDISKYDVYIRSLDSPLLSERLKSTLATITYR